MKTILSACHMKEADERTISQIGIPSPVLMERAALALCREAERFLCGEKKNSILAVCGGGNNGGDGFAAARILSERGHQVTVLFTGGGHSVSSECQRQMEIWQNLGGKIWFWGGNDENDCFGKPYDLIIDALFGIGLSRDLEGAYSRLVEKINSLGIPVIAADIPSGIDSDTARIRGCAVRADVTVTFASCKFGHILYPGYEYCGKVVLSPIGVACPEDDADALIPEEQDIRRILPERRAHSNKSTYGKPLLICGNSGMAGAALLCGESAARSGTGIVMLCSHKDNRTILQTALPEAVYVSWEETERLKQVFSGVSAVAIGPGLGTDETAKTLLRMTETFWDGPVVADADALNLLAQRNPVPAGQVSPEDDETEAEIRMIVTPHPKEMARLSHTEISDVLSDPVGCAVSFAKEHRVICVLKNDVTVVTDGKSVFLCREGCSGMATGGSGDALTGLIAGLLAQGTPPLWAALAGVWIHQKAGKAASFRKGEHGMITSDLVSEIPDVIRRISEIQ